MICLDTMNTSIRDDVCDPAQVMNSNAIESTTVRDLEAFSLCLDNQSTTKLVGHDISYSHNQLASNGTQQQHQHQYPTPPPQPAEDQNVSGPQIKRKRGRPRKTPKTTEEAIHVSIKKIPAPRSNSRRALGHASKSAAAHSAHPPIRPTPHPRPRQAHTYTYLAISFRGIFFFPPNFAYIIITYQ